MHTTINCAPALALLANVHRGSVTAGLSGRFGDGDSACRAGRCTGTSTAWLLPFPGCKPGPHHRVLGPGWDALKQRVAAVPHAAEPAVHGLGCVVHGAAVRQRQRLEAQAHSQGRYGQLRLQQSQADACADGGSQEGRLSGAVHPPAQLSCPSLHGWLEPVAHGPRPLVRRDCSPTSVARCGVPGPGEMTTLSNSPVSSRALTVGQSASSLRSTVGSSAG